MLIAIPGVPASGCGALSRASWTSRASLFATNNVAVGFDIGSQTVPEIAVSIVAELIARRNGGCLGVRGA